MLFITNNTEYQKYKSSQNELRNTKKKHILPWRNRKIGVEQVLIPGDSTSGDQWFYKREKKFIMPWLRKFHE